MCSRAFGPDFLCIVRCSNEKGMDNDNEAVFVATLAISVALVPRLEAQVQTEVPPVFPGAKPVTVEHIKIHGEALEGNLEGDAVDRDVIVFLPPSYAKEKHRRYPVVYALHGYSIGAEQWTHEIHVPQTIEGAFAKGSQEMIVVLPDSKTVYGGSMYSGSVTTGDFERFISHDVVAYIDAHYRTIPNRMSRGPDLLSDRKAVVQPSGGFLGLVQQMTRIFRRDLKGDHSM